MKFILLEFPFPDTNQLVNYTKMYEPVHAELGNLMRAVPEQLRSLNEVSVNIKTMQTHLMKALKDNIKMEVRGKMKLINYHFECTMS